MGRIYQNVFQKYPDPGTEILTNLLSNEITVGVAVKRFEERGIPITKRTIQRHLKKLKDNGKSIISKTTPSIIPADHQPPPQKSFKSYLDDIKDEFNAIDYKDVKKVDPIIILYKNLMKLEILMSRMEFDDNIKGLGDIIELERKIATEIHKMSPNTEEIDYNDLFRKNDLAIEFIIQQCKEYPDLKTSWLEYIKIHENL